MKSAIRLILLSCFLLSSDNTPFTIEIRPRVIDDAKVIVNVEVTNHVGRPVDYLEGFLAEFSAKKEFKGENRLVLIYNYEPALQTDFQPLKL